MSSFVATSLFPVLLSTLLRSTLYHPHLSSLLLSLFVRQLVGPDLDPRSDKPSVALSPLSTLHTDLRGTKLYQYFGVIYLKKQREKTNI